MRIKYRPFNPNITGESIMGECPICAAEVSLAKDAMAGELIVCDDCGAELEIIKIDPAELAEAPSAEEDWGQ
jgi:alpha-aminoadipate carrier protein LysW